MVIFHLFSRFSRFTRRIIGLFVRAFPTVQRSTNLKTARSTAVHKNSVGDSSIHNRRRLLLITQEGCDDD